MLPDAEYPQIPDGSPAEAWTDEVVNDTTDEDVEMIAHVDEQSTLTGSDSRPADHAAPTELELEWTAVQALRTPTFGLLVLEMLPLQLLALRVCAYLFHLSDMLQSAAAGLGKHVVGRHVLLITACTSAVARLFGGIVTDFMRLVAAMVAAHAAQRRWCEIEYLVGAVRTTKIRHARTHESQTTRHFYFWK